MYYHSTEAVDIPMEEDDSPWLDSSITTTTSSGLLTNNDSISTLEWNKLSSKYIDAGYREGITAGKQSTLQTGFDTGFTLSIPFARSVGSLTGLTASLLSYLSTTAGTKYHLPTTLLIIREEEVEEKEEIIKGCRELLKQLGKLNEGNCLPVDQEAIDHMKSHANTGTGTNGEEEEGEFVSEKKEMQGLEEALGAMNNDEETKKIIIKADGEGGIGECREVLRGLLIRAGLEGMRLDC